MSLLSLSSGTVFEKNSMSSGNFSFVMTITVLASVSIVAASEPIVYQFNSTRQSAMTSVRVLLPDRLMQIGKGNFQPEHVQIRDRMETLQTPHTWIEGTFREHSWHSGWLPVAFDLLTEMSQ